MRRKLLCYELNEVPWRVIDHYVQHRPGGAIARLLEQSDQYTSNTADDGELHPWSTWPTLHRGVANSVHGIRSLNQDLSAADPWPPVWQLLNDAGVTTGICASLQSYPPSRDPHMLFHVPDTFAAGCETVPRRYQPFQAMNLRQTRRNKAVVSAVGMPEVGEALKLLRTGIRPRTIMRVIQQVLAERSEPLYQRRRALLQPELAFDVLMHCLSNRQPSFVTFFTNHVAGILHRYWKYSFPEDFRGTLSDDAAARFHAGSLIVALDQVEAHLERLLPVCERYHYDLMLCSSMGQEAIERGVYVPEVRLADFEALRATLGLARDSVRQNLAMQPDVALEFNDPATLQRVRLALEALRDSAGHALFTTRYAPVGLTLNMALASSEALSLDGVIRRGEASYAAADVGLESFERDIGTGYHQPEGILVWHRASGAMDRQRAFVDTRAIAPSVLEFFGVARPSYMQPPIDASALIPARADRLPGVSDARPASTAAGAGNSRVTR